MLTTYILAVISVLILGFILKLPILPEKPMRNSWTISIIFPTLIIAIGLSAIFSYFKLDGFIYVGLLIGVFSAIFSKFLLERLFPIPDLGDIFE
jgi:energy-converting hydrogenase A subunit A